MIQHFEPESSNTIPKKTGRGANWCKEEDEQLCHSFIAITTNALVGTKQKGVAFWSRVKEHYQQNIGDKAAENRSNAAIKSRWNIINSSVQLYVSCYERILRGTQQSQSSPTDLVQKAYTLYKASFKPPKPFVLEHCWVILSVQPKWALHNVPKPKTVKKKDVNNSEVAETSASVEEIPRPIGYQKMNNLGKRTRQEEIGNYNSLHLEELKKEINEKKIRLQELVLQEEKERGKREQVAMDDKVMAMDLSIFKDPRQRLYFEKRRKDILLRLSAEVEEVVEVNNEVL